MSRLFIYTKDVQLLTGKGRTAAQKLISVIKKRFNKGRYEQITVAQFCAHTNLDTKLVIEQLS
ncbi:hypothetical protein [Pedobacter heparinus]|uniref:hypothetical protein n=1 Tax=Pedobacter heparinus TaxID=984 RepID=UPI00292D55E2|nr:hypothetical protein [Pedobacter heparinus]